MLIGRWLIQMKNVMDINNKAFSNLIIPCDRLTEDAFIRG